MAKIFVSYTQKDRAFVVQVAAALKDQGHEITVDVDSLSPGQNWRKTLADGLKASEVFVVFLSESSLASQSVLGEIGAARAYSEESDRMLFIPVLIDEIQIPNVVQDLLVVTAFDRNPVSVTQKIEAAIASFFGRRAAKEEQDAAFSRRIEANAAEYIEEAIRLLGTLESRNRWFGIVWYVSGFIALILGIVFAILGTVGLVNVGERGWLDFAILALKSIVVVGLLGACSKYAFTLGKSYVSESLKSADRMHAISFGKFYLRVYGSKATWPEVREVFQHWNIDRSSSFNSLATSEFDPKLLDTLVELARAVAGKKLEVK